MGSLQRIPGLDASGLPLLHFTLPIPGFTLSAFVGDANEQMLPRNFMGADLQLTGLPPAPRTDAMRVYSPKNHDAPSYIDTGILRTDAMTLIVVAGRRTSNTNNTEIPVSCARHYQHPGGGAGREGVSIELRGASAGCTAKLYRSTGTGWTEDFATVSSDNAADPVEAVRTQPEFVALTTGIAGNGRLNIAAHVGRRDGTIRTNSATVAASAGPGPNGLVAEETSPPDVPRTIHIGGWAAGGAANIVPVGYVGIAPFTCTAAQIEKIYRAVGARFNALGRPLYYT